MDAGYKRLARSLQEGPKQASTFAVSIVFITITSLVVVSRFHVRLHLVRGGLGVDDYLMGVGFVFTVALSVATMMCGWYGAGAHATDIPKENMRPLLQWNYATRLLYTVALGFVKFSILVFYRRLDPRKPTRLAISFLMVFVAALSITTFFFLAFVCTPPSLFWDLVAQQVSPEKCLSQSTQQMFFNLNGICNIIQDISMYLLPIPIIWSLQMPLRQKIALGALLSIGLVAVAAGCIRFYFVLFLAHEQDLWYYMADSLNWCNIEIYAAIVCSSASTFKALLKNYVPRFWNSQQNTPMNGNQGYDRSSSGQFAMKSSKTFSKKSTDNRKYGFIDITNVENGSEEAIVLPEYK